MKKEVIYFFIFIICCISVNADVVINEIMYNPTQSENYNEWIEIYNNGDENINLTGWTLCDIELLSGYVNHSDGDVYFDTAIILESNQYAVITDGGSGTDVYTNFDVNEDSIALHIDGSSMCNRGLGNDEDVVTIKNSEENIVDEIEYTDGLGADGNGMSLCRLNNSWYECNPTPGYDNTEGIVGNYSVRRVIDGDTLVLSNDQRVRLIGIDTPEEEEFYYEEATDRLRELVEGKNVTLERDIENIDIYNRLLRYVYVNNTFVNLVLVEEGFARAYPFEPNTQYEKEFYYAEKEARENRIGMWFYSPNITILSPENNFVIRTSSLWLNITTNQNSICEYTISYFWENPYCNLTLRMDDNDNVQINFTYNFTIDSNFSIIFGNLTFLIQGYVRTSSPINFSISNGFIHSVLVVDYNNTNSSMNERYRLNVKCTNEDELFSSERVYFTVEIPEDNNLPINNNIGDNTPTGGGGSSPKTYEIEISELNSLTLRRNDKIKFNFGNEEHSLRIKSISKEYIILVISSELQEFSFKLNEVKNIDLDLDGSYDIYVKVTDFDYSSVNVEIGEFVEEVVEGIKEEIEEVEEIEENITETETVHSNLITGAVTFLGEGDPLTGIIIMIAILFVGLFFYFILNRK